MACHHHITPLVVFITTCFIFAYTAVSSRDHMTFIPIVHSGTNNSVNGTTGGDCWTALYDVKLCSKEIASYFNNGTIDIGVSCCQAIKTVTHDCWSNLLSVLGIAVEESNVLRGYCDATHDSATPPVVDSVVQVLPEPSFVDIKNGTTM